MDAIPSRRALSSPFTRLRPLKYCSLRVFLGDRVACLARGDAKELDVKTEGQGDQQRSRRELFKNAAW